MSQDESPFPSRLVLRLAALPLVFVIVAAVEGRKGCHCGSSYAPSPPAAEEDVKKTRADVEADDTARRAALAVAKTTVFARPDKGPCAVPFHTIAGTKSPLGLSTPTLSHYDIPRWTADGGGAIDRFPDELLGIESIGIAYDDEVTVKPGPRKIRFDSDTKSGTISKLSLDLYADPKHHEHDFQLVIDKEVAGKVDNEESFTPGYLLGRFYVWSRTEKKIVCAAPILATNSETLHFRTGDAKLTSLIASDLREQAIAQAKERLSVVGTEPGTGPESEAPRGDSGAAPRDAGSRDGGPAHGDAGPRAAPLGTAPKLKAPPPF